MMSTTAITDRFKTHRMEDSAAKADQRKVGIVAAVTITS